MLVESSDIKAVDINDKKGNGKDKTVKAVMIVKKQGNISDKETSNDNTTNDNKGNKELISVDVSRDSDDETVDEFFNDMSKMMEKKGIMVNRSTTKYTLFDDAIPEE